MTHEADSVVMTRRDPQRNMARFYRLDLVPDLFGGVVLVRNWGRIGHRGQERQAWFSERAQALSEQATWTLRKQRRGYQVLEPNIVP